MHPTLQSLIRGLRGPSVGQLEADRNRLAEVLLPLAVAYGYNSDEAPELYELVARYFQLFTTREWASRLSFYCLMVYVPPLSWPSMLPLDVASKSND